MADYILEFQDVWKSYKDGKKELNALKGIDLALKKNSLNIILGPSGSGKTTLATLAGLLDTPTKGRILIKGRSTFNLSKSERSKIRRKEIGIIYQRDNLLPYLNVLENVMLSMVSPNQHKCIKALEAAELTEIGKFPEELSIEKQQRVTLVRAMINDPLLIIADEPTGELDTQGTEIIMDLIKQTKNKSTVLLASNNVDLREYGDEIFSLKERKLEKTD